MNAGAKAVAFLGKILGTGSNAFTSIIAVSGKSDDFAGALIKLEAKGISKIMMPDVKIKYLLVDDAGKAKGFKDMGYSFDKKSKLEDDLVTQLGNKFDDAKITDNPPWGPDMKFHQS